MSIEDDLIIGASDDNRPVITKEVPVEEKTEKEAEITVDETVDTEEAKEEPKDNKPAKDTKEEVSIKNAEQHYSTNLTNNKDTENMALPTDYGSKIREALTELPNINMSDNEAAREWIKTLNESLSSLPMQDMFRSTLEDPEAFFTQRPEHNGKPLTAMSPKFEKIENTVLKGEKAVIRIIQTLGLGNLIQIPLWHTGIYLTIKPPTEIELIALNRQLITDKIQFGRYNYGLAFSNTMCYTTDRLVEFVLDHIYNATIKSDVLTVDDLKKLINCQDIPILLWGILCTIYSNGYKYKRACISNPETCNHVIEATINISKLLWTNTSGLTDYQMEHMTHRQARSRSMEQIQKYKDELTKTHQSRVKLDIGKDVYVTIRTPSIYDYVTSGSQWLTNIVSSIEKTIASDVSIEEKNTLITRYGQASRLRQYSHWVEAIEIDTNITDDRETIDELLNVLSSDDDFSSSIMKKIRDYINGSVMAVIGIPEYDCPNCGSKQEGGSYPKLTKIIPLDVYTCFFTLTTQRLIKLTDR